MDQAILSESFILDSMNVTQPHFQGAALLVKEFYREEHEASLGEQETVAEPRSITVGAE